MTRTVIPFSVPDLSGFTRALGRALQEQFAAQAAAPSHQTLLNLVARAAGHRNLQALCASVRARPRLARGEPPPAPALSANARKALMQFDAGGRLVRWPNKYSVQALAMWVLWMQLDARRGYSEREITDRIRACIAYDDPVTLRRELINHRLMSRRPDGSDYRKLPARPDAEARALMAAWRAAVRR